MTPGGARPTGSRIRSSRQSSMESEGAGRQSPFFPSSANTNVSGMIPANFFMTSESCGRCHKDIYEQWNSSAHHFSSFNNQWYRKSIEYMQDVVGTQPSKWCAGCHDHAVFFNGRFDRPIKEQIDTPEAQAGLACTSCHSIVHVRQLDGAGRFRRRISAAARSGGEREPGASADARRCSLYLAPGAASRHVHQAVPPRADGGVLLVVPQGAPRRAGERLSLVPRLQRLRQLAGVGGVGAGRAVVLLSGAAGDVRRLPHAAGRVERSGGQERQGAIAPVSRRQYRAAVRQSTTRCS